MIDYMVDNEYTIEVDEESKPPHPEAKIQRCSLFQSRT
jgi:hypothetical protein